METFTIYFETPEKQTEQTEVQAHGPVQAERKFYSDPAHDQATVTEIVKDTTFDGERW